MTQDSLEMTEPLAPRHLLAAIAYVGLSIRSREELLVIRPNSDPLLAPLDEAIAIADWILSMPTREANDERARTVRENRRKPSERFRDHPLGTSDDFPAMGVGNLIPPGNGAAPGDA